MNSNNYNLEILSSAARTATVNSSDFNNNEYRGAQIVIDVTAVAATPSVVFSVEGYDDISGQYYSILDSAAITGTGTTVLTVYPGATASANVSTGNVIPATWRITATHADADSITYSVGANLVR